MTEYRLERPCGLERRERHTGVWNEVTPEMMMRMAPDDLRAVADTIDGGTKSAETPDVRTIRRDDIHVEELCIAGELSVTMGRRTDAHSWFLHVMRADGSYDHFTLYPYGGEIRVTLADSAVNSGEDE